MIEPIDNSSSSPEELQVKRRIESLEGRLKQISPKTQDTNGNSASSASTNVESNNDSSSISSAISELSASGVDVKESRLNSGPEGIDFSLKIKPSRLNDISIKGSFSSNNDQLTVFLNNTFDAQIESNGEKTSETFNTRIKFQVPNASETLQNRNAGQPQDIESVNEQILNHFLEVASSKQFPPQSIVLRLDDIGNLVSVAGEALFKVLDASLLLSSSLARATGQETPSLLELSLLKKQESQQAETNTDSKQSDGEFSADNPSSQQDAAANIRGFSFALQNVSAKRADTSANTTSANTTSANTSTTNVSSTATSTGSQTKQTGSS